MGTALVAVALVGAVQVPSLATGRGAHPSTSPQQVSSPLQRVSIVDFGFDPVTLTITKGTKVRWTNTGNVTHTSTSTTGAWDSGSIAPDDAFTRRFKKVGTFRYHCTIHTQMRGKIVVT
jgi:plastocyanin